MGKRSDFERKGRDYYRTFDARAYPPLLRFLDRGTKFVEPCAGEGDMVRALTGYGHECVYAADILPEPPTGLFSSTIMVADALTFERVPGVAYGDYEIITNPPWKRPLLHALIEHLRRHHPCWFLFDAGWAFSLQETVARKHRVPRVDELMRHCEMIVAVGRLQWQENTEHSAVDDVAWYRFTDQIYPFTQFYGKEL